MFLAVAMRALGFEPKKEEIKKMIADIDKVSPIWYTRQYWWHILISPHAQLPKPSLHIAWLSCAGWQRHY